MDATACVRVSERESEGERRQKKGRATRRGTCSQLAADCAQIMHKCNYALCCGLCFDHVKMPSHSATVMQTNWAGQGQGKMGRWAEVRE